MGTPASDNNLDDSLNNSKQRLLSPERNMSPAKLAFQRKFNRSDRHSPAKTQKHKMPKFDEKWMTEMEQKSTLSNSPLFAPRSDNEKKKYDVSDGLKKSVDDKKK